MSELFENESLNMQRQSDFADKKKAKWFVLHSSSVKLLSAIIPHSTSSLGLLKLSPLLTKMTNSKTPFLKLESNHLFNSFFPPTLKNTSSIWAAKHSHGMLGYWTWIRPQFKLYFKEKIKLRFEELVKFSKSSNSIIWTAHFIILHVSKKKKRYNLY